MTVRDGFCFISEGHREYEGKFSRWKANKVWIENWAWTVFRLYLKSREEIFIFIQYSIREVQMKRDDLVFYASLLVA